MKNAIQSRRQSWVWHYGTEAAAEVRVKGKRYQNMDFVAINRSELSRLSAPVAAAAAAEKDNNR